MVAVAEMGDEDVVDLLEVIACLGQLFQAARARVEQGYFPPDFEGMACRAPLARGND